MEKVVKILVIDDDPDIGNMIKMLLEYKGYAVALLDNTENGIETLRNNPIDLVIMDMLLSGSNGIDVCVLIKKDPALAHIPVIMMSAHPDAEKICLQSGANDFISKPFEMQDILSKIEALTNIPS